MPGTTAADHALFALSQPLQAGPITEHDHPRAVHNIQRLAEGVEQLRQFGGTGSRSGHGAGRRGKETYRDSNAEGGRKTTIGHFTIVAARVRGVPGGGNTRADAEVMPRPAASEACTSGRP